MDCTVMSDVVLVVLGEMHGIHGAVEQRRDPRGQAKRHVGIRPAFGNRKNGFVQASPPSTTPQTTVTARCVKGPRPPRRREMIARCIFPWDDFPGSTSWMVATPGGSGSPAVGSGMQSRQLGPFASTRGSTWMLVAWPAGVYFAVPSECHRAGRDLDGSRQRVDDRQQLELRAGTDRHRDVHQQRRADGRHHFEHARRSTRWSSPRRRRPIRSP